MHKISHCGHSNRGIGSLGLPLCAVRMCCSILDLLQLSFSQLLFRECMIFASLVSVVQYFLISRELAKIENASFDRFDYRLIFFDVVDALFKHHKFVGHFILIRSNSTKMYSQNMYFLNNFFRSKTPNHSVQSKLKSSTIPSDFFVWFHFDVSFKWEAMKFEQKFGV